MKRKNILSIFIFCFLVSAFISSCSKSGSSYNSPGNTGGTGGGGGTNSVGVDITSGMSFSPGSVTVKVGTTVKWTNNDIYSAHTVTSDDGTTFNSGSIPSGGTYTYTPTAAGTFAYHCTLHAGMTGTLVVTN